MKRRPLPKSSSLASVGYDRETSTLEIEFREGGIYAYHLVPANVYRELLEAASAGRYFLDKIRNRFPAKRLK